MTDDRQERAREVLAETLGVKREALNYAFLIPHDDALRAMLAFLEQEKDLARGS